MDLPTPYLFPIYLYRYRHHIPSLKYRRIDATITNFLAVCPSISCFLRLHKIDAMAFYL